MELQELISFQSHLSPALNAEPFVVSVLDKVLSDMLRTSSKLFVSLHLIEEACSLVGTLCFWPWLRLLLCESTVEMVRVLFVPILLLLVSFAMRILSVHSLPSALARE